jgi:hypothetical protein
MTMLILGVCALAVVAVVAHVSAGQEGTAAPGQMTRARVWVENRSRSEAIPIVVQNVARDALPLRVQLVGATDPNDTTLTTRAARQRWEYRSVSVQAGSDPAVMVAGLGAEGWEAAGLTTGADARIVVLLKRPQ